MHRILDRRFVHFSLISSNNHATSIPSASSYLNKLSFPVQILVHLRFLLFMSPFGFDCSYVIKDHLNYHTKKHNIIPELQGSGDKTKKKMKVKILRSWLWPIVSGLPEPLVWPGRSHTRSTPREVWSYQHASWYTFLASPERLNAP